jgi:uncharacterized protein
MCNGTSENLEIPGLVLTHHPGMTENGLLRFNDVTSRFPEIGWCYASQFAKIANMKSAAYNIVQPAPSSSDIAARVAAIDWGQAASDLDAQGCAVLKGLLSADECRALAALYPEEAHFRSRVVMGRHGFGRGEYKYFCHPLPALIAELRPNLYAPLCGIANRWNEAIGIDISYPESHDAFLRRCHAAGQVRPTPLLLQYGAGDYNCLHQDLYGEHVFPLQVAILLSEPGRDFSGGEFVLTEQRPRMQSRAEVVPLLQGDAVAFAVHVRPVQGTRGFYRVNLRHGVSRVRSGHRHTVGLIFHDAK